MDSLGDTCSFKLIQNVYGGNLILSVKRQVLCMNGRFLTHFPHLRGHYVISSLQCVDETVPTEVNCCLVAFANRYHNFDSELGILSLVRRRCWRAKVSVTKMAPTTPLLVTVINT